MMPNPCSIESCGHGKRSKGMCNKHYKRYRKVVPYEPQQSRHEWMLENYNANTDECVVWPAAAGTGRYFQVTIEGENRGAHRVVCELVHGPAPTEAHHAAHSCGNRPCINARHLRWATPAENCADKIKHGTYTSGEHSLKSKLRNEDAAAIYRDNRRISHIARAYGIHPKAVSLIKQGKTYRNALGMA